MDGEHNDPLLQKAQMYNVNEMSEDDDNYPDEDESLEKADLDL